MYLSLRPFDRLSDLARLPAPEASRPRRNPVVVPISPVEISHLAQRFPTAWRRDANGWDLVAVTGLTKTHDYWLPTPAPDGAIVAPLLLRTFPLTLLDDGANDNLPVLVDETALSLGAPALSKEARAAREAEFDRRCMALWTFVNSRRALAPISAALDAAGAFRPWDLAFARDEATYGIGGLHCVDWSYFGGDDHRRLVAQFGWLAANVLTMHRVSQHRMNTILRDMADKT